MQTIVLIARRRKQARHTVFTVYCLLLKVILVGFAPDTIIYSLFRTKCSQDRDTVYKTQKMDTQTKEKKVLKTY